ncbi:DoxX family membrane protein [Nocardia puris]|uniref:Putative membrane protein YphA (DoxX/SURF4 family) n=1 Tax=Nocardia puris TaxID=208602 RepID=A0A366CVK1_9NOCA|nr:DoxX family protein [Nocardia puris]MBF6216002.1 DoxX family membrane protein [Nocardia puris]RBO80108.1 putative membrane protein YphA (DoxX/SURF4 family) [Nocardia puris]
MLLRRLARPLLATAFVADGIDTLIHPQSRAKTAATLVQQGERSLPPGVVQKLPSDPGTVVRVNAIAQVSGGVLLALGRAPRFASLVLAATVVPATVTEQDFWAEQDPDRKIAKRNAFLKDVSLLGGLLIASADTEGKPSLGWRGRRAARNAAATVSAALPFGATADNATGEALRHNAHEAAERAKALGSTAAAKGAEVAGTIQEHGPDWAATARKRGAALAAVLMARGAEFASAAKEHGAEWAEVAKERGAEARHRGAELSEVARHRGAELAEVAKERGAELGEVAKTRGAELGEVAKVRGADLGEAAKTRGAELAEVAKERGSEFGEVAKARGAELGEIAKARGAELGEIAKKRGRGVG